MKLTGFYEESVLKLDGVTSYKTDITCQVKRKISLQVKDDKLKFSFTDNKGVFDPNQIEIITYSGTINDLKISYGERLDNSQGLWRKAEFTGKFHAGYAKHTHDYNLIERFVIEQHQEGLVSVFAKWPCRPYPRAELVMCQESTLMYFDQKGQQAFEDLILKVKDGRI